MSSPEAVDLLHRISERATSIDKNLEKSFLRCIKLLQRKLIDQSAGAHMAFLFDPSKTKSIPVKGERKHYPVNRIFCVGRNYVDHAKEMGLAVDREKPFYFTKAATHFQNSGTTVVYPGGTTNFHYEVELVVAIGKKIFNGDLEKARKAVFGYAVGLDLTRRDLQLSERAHQRPWDLGKDVEQSAIVSTITKAKDFGIVGPQRIHLSLNGEIKQDSRLSELVWKVDEIIAHLSKFYHLAPGDLIMTGTPAGVGPVLPGDKIKGGIDGLEPISIKIGNPR
jgi:fumarylpyruvate hydrolase